MGRIAQVASVLCFASIAPRPIVGQTPAAIEPIPVVTVCEVLADLGRFNGKSIIVIGKQSGTMEGSWLMADCEKELVTDGFTWDDSISLSYVRGGGDPPPRLPAGFEWNTKLVDAKRKQARRTGRPKLPPDYNYTWRAFFGRLETRLPLQTVRWGNGELRGYGFGHLNTSPAQPIWPEDPRASRSLQ